MQLKKLTKICQVKRHVDVSLIGNGCFVGDSEIITGVLPNYDVIVSDQTIEVYEIEASVSPKIYVFQTNFYQKFKAAIRYNEFYNKKRFTQDTFASSRYRQSRIKNGFQILKKGDSKVKYFASKEINSQNSSINVSNNFKRHQFKALIQQRDSVLNNISYSKGPPKIMKLSQIRTFDGNKSKKKRMKMRRSKSSARSTILNNLETGLRMNENSRAVNSVVRQINDHYYPISSLKGSFKVKNTQIRMESPSRRTKGNLYVDLSYKRPSSSMNRIKNYSVGQIEEDKPRLQPSRAQGDASPSINYDIQINDMKVVDSNTHSKSNLHSRHTKIGIGLRKEFEEDDYRPRLGMGQASRQQTRYGLRKSVTRLRRNQSASLSNKGLSQSQSRLGETSDLREVNISKFRSFLKNSSQISVFLFITPSRRSTKSKETELLHGPLLPLSTKLSQT